MKPILLVFLPVLLSAQAPPMTQQQATQFLVSAWQATLQRTPNTAGLTGQINALVAGTLTQERCIWNLLNSAEFAASASDQAAFVAKLTGPPSTIPATSIVAAISGHSMTFTCSGVPNCPTPVNVTSGGPATMFVGLTYTGLLHVGVDANLTLGHYLTDCSATTPTCAQDATLSAMPGEMEIARATIAGGTTGGTLGGLQQLWTGYPVLPTVILNCTTCGVSVSQTPTTVTVTAP